MRRLSLCLCLLAASLLTGCSQFRRNLGRPLPGDAELAAMLNVGTTTKAQALDRLGAPVSIRRQHDGDLLLWNRAHEWHDTLNLIPFIPIYHRATGEVRWDRLALLFDPNGVLAGLGIERDIDQDAPAARQPSADAP